MKVSAGDKITVSLANGVPWPAVAITDEVATPRVTRSGVDIIVTTFDCISQRISLEEQAKKDAGEPFETYLALTNEVAMYGFRVVARPRHSNIVGLDVTADGTLITDEELTETQGLSYSAFQKAQFDLRNGATDALDL